MKRVNKLAAAVAVALSVGLAPQANAVIEMKANGAGDALLFPAFNGYVENYYTITNTSGYWVQGHIRFRGASWSSELLDFDVILSPGDVFLFRLADMDGDGQWEIDMTLDPSNFKYTSVQPTGCDGKCLDGSFALEPRECPVPPLKPISDALIQHQRHVGYIEFIGESILDGMTAARMNALLTAGSNLAAVGLSEANRTKVGNGLGTNGWVWSDFAGGFAADRGLSDFMNVATGTGFIGLPGTSTRLTYNAESFLDFRTDLNLHRVDNYARRGTHTYGGVGAPDFAMPTMLQPYVAADDNAVIVHHENSDIDGSYDYVYRFQPEFTESRLDESRVSFNNTWGPTLSDGDDYWTDGAQYLMVDLVNDYWDNRLLVPNSLAEMEQAIRLGGQNFESYYFDGASLGGSALKSWYFVHFPTKFYYGERSDYYQQTRFNGNGYVCRAVDYLLNSAKQVKVQVWDIFENSGGQAGGANTSPRTPEIRTTSLGQELSFFGIDFFKAPFNIGDVSKYTSGRAVLSPQYNLPLPTPADVERSMPFMGYTFEYGNQDRALGQWRSMHRY